MSISPDLITSRLFFRMTNANRSEGIAARSGMVTVHATCAPGCEIPPGVVGRSVTSALSLRLAISATSSALIVSRPNPDNLITDDMPSLGSNVIALTTASYPKSAGGHVLACRCLLRTQIRQRCIYLGGPEGDAWDMDEHVEGSANVDVDEEVQHSHPLRAIDH